MKINTQSMSLGSRLKGLLRGRKITEPREAYDTWALGYDNQPGNLILDLDEQVTGGFLEKTRLEEKIVVDIGCGTGRHWKRILLKKPARLVGFDVSGGMLAKLKEKFPMAETYLVDGNGLSAPEGLYCDFILSTLTIAHIGDIEEAFGAWNKILKPGGEIYISENHPTALSKGGERTFKHDGRLVSVRNYIHSFEKIRELAKQLGWTETCFTEKIIDDSVKHYYERKNALAVFEQFRGVPVFYSIHLKKKDDPA